MALLGTITQRLLGAWENTDVVDVFVSGIVTFYLSVNL